MGKIIKKLNRLDTHDRLEHFKKQEFDIGKCCQDIIDKRPFGSYPFYILAHARTEDNEPGVKRVIWQPRLTKPRAQENSMLFRVRPPSDVVSVLWIIPASELWPQFLENTMFKDSIIVESILKFKTNKSLLEEREKDDLTDKEIDKIYREISKSAKKDKPKTPIKPQ